MQRFQVYAGLLTLILIGWAALVGFVPSMSGGMRIDEDFSEIPTKIAGWEGTDSPTGERTYELLPTCSILSREYVDGFGNRVSLSIVYGRELGDFHQPEFCMEGVGWKRTSSGLVWIRPKTGKPHRATVISLSNDFEDIVMVYWFYMGGQTAPSMGKQKALALLDALASGELPPSAMVKFTAPILVDLKSAQETAVKMAEMLDKSIIDMARKPPKFVSSSQPRGNVSSE